MLKNYNEVIPDCNRDQTSDFDLLGNPTPCFGTRTPYYVGNQWSICLGPVVLDNARLLELDF